MVVPRDPTEVERERRRNEVVNAWKRAAAIRSTERVEGMSWQQVCMLLNSTLTQTEYVRRHDAMGDGKPVVQRDHLLVDAATLARARKHPGVLEQTTGAVALRIEESKILLLIAEDDCTTGRVRTIGERVAPFLTGKTTMRVKWEPFSLEQPGQVVEGTEMPRRHKGRAEAQGSERASAMQMRS
jgi:hypothetical protein